MQMSCMENYHKLQRLVYQRLENFVSFSYTAQFPEKYPFYDRRPLVYVMDFQEDKMLGGNLHYLNPDYRDGVAKGLINKGRCHITKEDITQIFF